MCLIDIDDKIKNSICFFVKSPIADDLIELKINDELEKAIIYPTSDLYLTKKQFESFKAFLLNIYEDNFLLTQFGTGQDGVFSSCNKAYRFNKNVSYEDYYRLNLYSLTMLFSINKTWAIFIDETADAGIGLFLGEKNISKVFKSIFYTTRENYEKQISYIRETLNKNENKYLSLLINKI